MSSTHGKRIGFGKHKGERFTRIPVGYLKWMICKETQEWKTARKELERRGTPEPSIELSAHAIDRASLRIRRTWHENRGDDEGLYTWLAKAADYAIYQAGGLAAVAKNNDRAEAYGITFVFEISGKWPVLKTVHIAKKKR